MTKAPPTCTKCSAILPADFINQGEFQACPTCASSLKLEVFPSFFREIVRGSAGDPLMANTEASCFYHSQKRAAVVCAQCGRFLCSLCDLELEGRHFCASCLQDAKSKGSISSIENGRTLYDTMAVQLAILGIAIFYLSPVAAPLALYFAIKHRKTPSSIVRRPSRWRIITAITLASLQLLGWMGLIIFLILR